MRLLCLGTAVTFALSFAAAAHAADDLSLPVLLESPGCDHAKLGSVEIEVGERVRESTQDPNVPTVEYARAFARLADAAARKGANAVVLRSHQGIYFTYQGRQSRLPVYIKLRGAAIRLPEGEGQCDLVFVHAAELQQRAATTKPLNTTSGKAYTND
ncbi:MAG TPA: hypothetical protein VFR30_05290 [Lysobacter sp.]|nr:hypothetical protein [Lysobacter sp.]